MKLFVWFLNNVRLFIFRLNAKIRKAVGKYFTLKLYKYVNHF